jgi:type IV secretory pathway TrbF-like protein
VKKHWSDAYAFLTTKGQNQLKSYAAEDKIFERISLEMVSVEVQNIVSINDDSYEIHWVEKTFNNQGVLIKTERYAGIFNVRFVKPKTTKRLLKNPLGIMVDSFNLSKQF